MWTVAVPYRADNQDVMTHARFAIQAVVVVALMLLVSWPERGQVPAGTMWRANGPLATRRPAIDAARQGAGRKGQFGPGSISYAGSSPTDEPDALRRLFENDVERRHRRPAPAAVLALGGKLNGIIGRARTALNAPIPNARLVLRSLTTGIVEAWATADGSGEFAFLDVAPSGYIVELTGPNGDVVAVSDAIAIDIGDLRLTSVRAPATGDLQALFGNVLASTADEPVQAAARGGVTQVVASARCVSPPCGN